MAESTPFNQDPLPAQALTPGEVESFRLLLQEECGLDLDVDQAWRLASKLIGLYRMLMGPIPEDPGVRTSDHLPSSPVENNRVLG
jgi:hypothetical protein